MLRLLLPMVLMTGVLVGLVLLVDLAGRTVRGRRLGRQERRRLARVREDQERETEALRRARLSLARARHARVSERIGALLQEPDIDRLPPTQVAGLLVAVDDLGEASRACEAEPRAGSDEAGSAAYEAAVAHAENVAASADRDLRAARLAGDDDTTA